MVARPPRRRWALRRRATVHHVEYHARPGRVARVAVPVDHRLRSVSPAPGHRDGVHPRPRCTLADLAHRSAVRRASRSRRRSHLRRGHGPATAVVHVWAPNSLRRPPPATPRNCPHFADGDHCLIRPQANRRTGLAENWPPKRARQRLFGALRDAQMGYEAGQASGTPAQSSKRTENRGFAETNWRCL
jgi:hypothetical protein